MKLKMCIILIGDAPWFNAKEMVQHTIGIFTRCCLEKCDLTGLSYL